MPDVVCLGILVADVIALPVDAYPRRGELTLCREMRPSIGGCAANTGIGLHKLGVPTGVMGKVGSDGFGEFVRSTLTGHGLDVRGVATSQGVDTSATMVMIAADGERSFIHCIGANADIKLDDIDWDLIGSARLLHIAGSLLMAGFDGEPCAEVLRRARAMGVTTSLDTAWDATGRWMELIKPTLPHLDYIVPSFSEARRCVTSYGIDDSDPRAVARVFQDEGVGVVALKMGEDGSYIRQGDEEWWLPPFHVHAVDATGAGDAFAAGFLAGVMNGFDMPTTGKLANAVGASCVTAVGTVTGIKSLPATLEFIAEQEKQGWRPRA